MDSITDDTANKMCLAEGYAKGGIKMIKKAKDPVPDVNSQTGFAKMISCPKTNRIFAKKCGVMVLPEGKSCEDA